MQVKDIFRMSDGSIVLIGVVPDEIPFVRAFNGKLVIDGKEHATIRIEGESIPDRKPQSGYRAVSTRDSVPVDRSLVQQHDCLLISCDA